MNGVRRVLVVDDNEDDFIIARDMLVEHPVHGAHYLDSVKWAGSFEEGIRELYDRVYDVVLLDYSLPPRTGLEFLEECRGFGCDTPVILLTGQADYTLDVAAMNLGAAEYLEKGSLTPKSLERAVRYAVERRRAELERDRFFDVCLDMLCTASLDGFLTRVNRSFERVLGYPTEVLKSQPFLSFVHPDDVESTVGIFREIAAGRIVRSFVNRYRCTDGSFKALKWNSICYDGTVYASAHDVSEMLQLESELRELNGQLELRVAERTAELENANRELQLARAEADRSNQAKSEFLSRMSHELRTPMNAILGFGQLLQAREKDGVAKESVEHILKAGRHLLALVNEVLNLSGVEAGHTSLSLEPVELGPVVAETVSLMRPLTRGLKVQLEIDSSAGERHIVMADRQRLKQILINLVSNAVKYNRPRGKVSVSSIRRVDGTVGLSVRDTGVGLHESDMSRLFQAFERLHASNSKIEGTGLGLVLSERLAKLMAGRLEVESRLGEGSRFTLVLPEARLPEPPTPSAAVSILSSLPVEGGAAHPAKPLTTVLCVEDNPLNLALMEAIFNAEQGFKIVAAIQGRIALDLISQDLPDVLLLDLNLPDIHGLDVLRILKQDPRTAGIPVLVLSADATDKHIGPVMEAGAVAYLTKPLDVNALLESVRNALNR